MKYLKYYYSLSGFAIVFLFIFFLATLLTVWYQTTMMLMLTIFLDIYCEFLVVIVDNYEHLVSQYTRTSMCARYRLNGGRANRETNNII